MKKIIFISGLSGTGKSTLKKYFDKNPIEGYRVYDFDMGKYGCPEDEKDHLEWRRKQTEHWLEVSAENLKLNIGTIIFGLALYPEFIHEIAEKYGIDQSVIRFGVLTCDSGERKQRLFGRGTPHHWKGEKEWYEEFHRKQAEIGALEINTSRLKLHEAAREIINKLVGE